ncbi:replication initiator [Streptomyces sp. NPDC059863]|uniref:replication initiator n=1 Tax=Streptomyces sp. NPDC059863 TaxID=3346976 RepID=UPI00364CA6FA
MRLDGPDGTSQPPPPYATVTVTVLADAVRAAAARVRVTVESDAVGERELGWGEELDVREITALGTDAESTDHGRGRPRGEVRHNARWRLRRPRPRPVLPPLPGTRRHPPAPRRRRGRRVSMSVSFTLHQREMGKGSLLNTSKHEERISQEEAEITDRVTRRTDVKLRTCSLEQARRRAPVPGLRSKRAQTADQPPFGR